MAINLIVKVSNACNMACKYPCYYFNRIERSDSVMDLSTLERLYQEVRKIKSLPKVNTIWHGGEPLIAGLSWFKEALKIQESIFVGSGVTLENSVQTNGILIDRKWAEFFGENNFQVGISIDGLNHDFFRVMKNGSPTLDKVLNAFKIMREHGSGAGGLAVITKKSLNEAKELLQFMLSNGINSFDILPNTERGKDGNLTKYSLTGEEFGEFILDLYEAWLREDRDDVRIRTIEQLVGGLLGTKPDLCSFCVGCGGVLSIDTNGDVYPCDEFVGQSSLLLGNINKTGLRSLIASTIYKDFVKQSYKMPEECTKCEYLKICGGNCSKFRVFDHSESQCNGRKKAFTGIQRSLVNLGYI